MYKEVEGGTSCQGWFTRACRRLKGDVEFHPITQTFLSFSCCFPWKEGGRHCKWTLDCCWSELKTHCIHSCSLHTIPEMQRQGIGTEIPQSILAKDARKIDCWFLFKRNSFTYTHKQTVRLHRGPQHLWLSVERRHTMQPILGVISNCQRVQIVLSYWLQLGLVVPTLSNEVVKWSVIWLHMTYDSSLSILAVVVQGITVGH